MLLPLDNEIELSANKRHRREDNSPGVKQLLQTRGRQTGMHTIANHVTVVSYWAKLAVDVRRLRRRAFAIRRRILKAA